MQGIGQQDYDWIGWKKQMSTVNLTFQFSCRQRFTAIRLHTSNLFTRGIYLFDSIVIQTCANISYERIESNILMDTSNASARWIEIRVDQNSKFIGHCVQILLTFNNRSQWMFISEVQFDSTAEVHNHGPVLIGNS
jgi:hypothetical protein